MARSSCVISLSRCRVKTGARYDLAYSESGVVMTQHHQHHDIAAKHLEAAAHHHREAHKAHAAGEHHKVAHHAHMAQGHQLHATEHHEHAARLHAQHHSEHPPDPPSRK